MEKHDHTNPCVDLDHPVCTTNSGFQIVNSSNMLGITCSNGFIHPPVYKNGAPTGEINRNCKLNAKKDAFIPIIGEHEHVAKYPVEEDFIDEHRHLPNSFTHFG